MSLFVKNGKFFSFLFSIPVMQNYDKPRFFHMVFFVNFDI